MPQSRRTHILFDFFGTLVDYSASRTDQGYERSYELLQKLGVALTYQEFLAACAQTFADFDRLSDQDDHEFSMIDVGTAFLAGVLPHEPTLTEVEEFVTRYIGEWNTGVHYLPGVTDLVERLAERYRLAVVTNTHQATLVPRHLESMGVLSFFDAVVTSVEVGWRKPHPEIYSTALDTLGIHASSAVFVGDTYVPDFQGPQRAGIEAFLIDPQFRAPAVPETRRLHSIFDLPDRLADLQEKEG